MPITVEPCADTGKTPLAERGRTGISAERWYWVDGTIDPVEAMTAPGIPQPGESWSAAAPFATCDRVRFEFYGKTADDPGRMLAHAVYTTPGFGGRPKLKPGLKSTTRLGSLARDYRVFFDQVVPTNTAVINNGQGTSWEYGLLEFRVLIAMTVTQFQAKLLSIAKLNHLRPTNLNQVVLPPLFADVAPGGASFSFSPYRLVYGGFEVDVEGDLLGVSHSVLFAGDEDGILQDRWVKELPPGQTIQPADIQYAFPMPALAWPDIF